MTRRDASRGFTLIEVMIAAAILSIAVVGLLSVLTSAQRLQQQNKETTLAMNAIRDKLEELRNYPVFASTTGTSLPITQWYTQVGTEPRSGLPWNTFGVPGLNADRAWSTATSPTDDANGNLFADADEPGDSDGDLIVGRVTFFTDETQNDPDSARVGIPGLDLDGDGAATTTNVAQDADADNDLDYILLPVTVRIEWRSGSGSRAMQVSTLLSARR